MRKKRKVFELKTLFFVLKSGLFLIGDARTTVVDEVRSRELA